MRIPYMTQVEIMSLSEKDIFFLDKEFNEWLYSETKKTKEERFELTLKGYKRMLLEIFEMQETQKRFRFRKKRKSAQEKEEL